jgi:type IV secretory pathway VirB2 component (pilin)
LWGYLQDVTVGYGYRPGRALTWLVVLIVVAGVCSTVWEPRPVTSSAPTFNAVVYALDVVLPILDLGQEKSYSAVGFGRVVVWVAILSGWLLASTVIASITRAVNRN